MFAEAVQVVYIIEEWVDHAYFKLKDEEARRVLAVKTLVIAKRKAKTLLLSLLKLRRKGKVLRLLWQGSRSRPMSSASIFERLKRN